MMFQHMQLYANKELSCKQERSTRGAGAALQGTYLWPGHVLHAQEALHLGRQVTRAASRAGGPLLLPLLCWLVTSPLGCLLPGSLPISCREHGTARLPHCGRLLPRSLLLLFLLLLLILLGILIFIGLLMLGVCDGAKNRCITS